MDQMQSWQSGEVGNRQLQRWAIARGRNWGVASLKKAQKDAQGMPLEAQIRAREVFIERAQSSVQPKSRDWRRVRNEWRSSGLSSPTPADGVGSATTVAGHSRHSGRLTEEEVLEWLADGQEDINTALLAGNPVLEAARPWRRASAAESHGLTLSPPTSQPADAVPVKTCNHPWGLPCVPLTFDVDVVETPTVGKARDNSRVEFGKSQEQKEDITKYDSGACAVLQ